MSNIAQVQLSDTFDYQRKRINDAIDIVNSMGGGITEVASETSLPDPASATSNVYLIRNHTKFKGAALAALINGIYKITPLKNDVMNSNQFIYIDAAQLSSSASINKCVYLDSTGVWQLANSSDPNKYAQGIVGPYNSIILGGILYSAGLNLIKGATYYYNSSGTLTTEETIGKVGVALDSHTLSLHFLSINTNIQDKSTAVNYNHITNCLTEIPRDIKLELKEINGVKTLMLKAGSKVYVPNGFESNGTTPKFDEINIANDINITETGGTGQCLICIDANGRLSAASAIAACVSGAGVEHKNFGMCYDTSTNIIQRWGDGVITIDKASLPLAVVSIANGVFTSIDQVFNGFGYIGSCVFTLPGVKGLYPNGRNEDGTLKNGLINCTTVQVSSNFNDTLEHTLMINPNGRCAWYSTTGWHYNDIANVIVASTGTVLTSATLGTFKTTNGTVSNLNPYEVFHAVDYSDLKLVSKSNNGLVPKLPNETTVKKFFRQDGTWSEPDIKLVSKSNDGLVPKLPNETTVKKFFRQDGAWSEPNCISKSGDTMTGVLSDVKSAQVRNIVILDQEQGTGVNGTIYMVIEGY